MAETRHTVSYLTLRRSLYISTMEIPLVKRMIKINIVAVYISLYLLLPPFQGVGALGCLGIQGVWGGVALLLMVLLSYSTASRMFHNSSTIFERLVNSPPFIFYALVMNRLFLHLFPESKKWRGYLFLLASGVLIGIGFLYGWGGETLLAFRCLRWVFLPYLGLLLFKGAAQRPEMRVAVENLAPVLVMFKPEK